MAKLIEDIYSSHRISQEEMKRLMIDESSRLAELLTMKRDDPAKYDRFIRNYNRTWCVKWER